MTAAPEISQKLSVEIRNPGTGGIAGKVSWTEPSKVPGIVASLAAEQQKWEKSGFDERAKIVARYIQWLMAHRVRLEKLLVSETGKSTMDASLEMPMVAQVAAFYVKNGKKFLAPDKRPSSAAVIVTKRVTVHYRPRAVVGIIAPWNYPLVNALMDSIPALLAGCAVLLKPSERTPLTAEALVEGWLESGAPPVFSHVQGAREISEALIDNVDFVQFTGSTATGKLVMERAAKQLTPVSLELGGKDPMIVLEDANIVRAAQAAVWGGLFNAGQTCVSVERVYVHESVYDAFVQTVVAEVEALSLGSGDGHDVGALVDEQQLKIVESHVMQALAAGARALTGGKRADRPGSYYEPTVLVDVDHSMLCMTEETFGPTLPIMKVSSEAEAIRLANESPYGLSASVWSNNLKRAQQVAKQLDCGAVNINDVISNLIALTAPHGGWKNSGIGARFGGADGMRKYCRAEAVVVSHMTQKAEMNWYGSSLRMQKFANKLFSTSAMFSLNRKAK
ncbi:MAG: aldehyde dehydrogenase family protein [Mycobacteriaceae bacterium]